MKYLRNLNNHNDYIAFIESTDFAEIHAEKNAVVSYCKTEEHVHYNPYIPPLPQFLDILYSDTNGNLSFTSEVLPASEGKTPIGLCVVSTGFFGTNEKARWMSLKYMYCETPEAGSLTFQNMMWGNHGTDINTIDNIQTAYNGGDMWGCLTADWITNTSSKIPSLFDANGNWNLTELGDVNRFTATDIDGKNKTEKILATATAQSDWMTATAITNNSGAGYAPAACCCARYHTLGTQSGDWYLGAAGEMSMIIVQKQQINAKLTEIANVYANDCIRTFGNNYYQTSTEYNTTDIYRANAQRGSLDNTGKNGNMGVIAMLRY